MELILVIKTSQSSFFHVVLQKHQMITLAIFRIEKGIVQKWIQFRFQFGCFSFLLYHSTVNHDQSIIELLDDCGEEFEGFTIDYDEIWAYLKKKFDFWATCSI
jgi:hypothetical protein